MQARIVQMGLGRCQVCDSGELYVIKLPLIAQVGGTAQVAAKGDEEVDVLYMVGVECSACGHLLQFDSRRLVPDEKATLVIGLTAEQEAEYEATNPDFEP